MAVYVYNDALAMSDFGSNDKLDFIVRPDGGSFSSAPNPVPEPISFILFISGSVPLVIGRYLKRKGLRRKSANYAGITEWRM